MKKTSPISCLIPTFNGVHLLQKHLPSVLAALQDKDHLIIIDDASTDATVDWLKEFFSLQLANEGSNTVPYEIYQGTYHHSSKSIKILLIRNHENLRFAKNVNRAVQLCNTPYFFLVNNDVSVKGDAITILREQIATDSSIFAVGCLEFEQNEHGEKSGKNILWFEKGLFQHSKAIEFESGETAWASGGSAMFATEKWRELKGFDEVFYPAYWEDTDISMRARKKGWKVLFNQHAVVYHKHESTNVEVFGSSSLSNISWKNAFTFAWKHATLPQKLQIIFWYPYWQLQRLKQLSVRI